MIVDRDLFRRSASRASSSMPAGARRSLPRLILASAVVLGVATVGAAVEAAPGSPALLGAASTCVKAVGASPGDAVIVNITNTDVAAEGWGSLRLPSAQPVYQRAPAVQYSNVNFAPKTPPNPNVGLVSVGPDSTFCYDGAVGATNVILDQLAVIPAASLKVADPTRLLDTRASGKIGPNASVCVKAVGAAAGDAVVVNITNTDAAAEGWGSLRLPTATPVYNRPAAVQYSNVNYAPNTPANPNVGLVSVGADLTFCYDGAVAAANVILDQLAVIPAASLKVADPTRLLDTRTSGKIGPNASVCVKAVGAAAGDAVVVNITNTDVVADGWGALRLPTATPVYSRPAAVQYSNLNYAPKTTANPNVGIVSVGADLTFCYDGAVGAANVILDQLAVIPAASLKVTDPTRALDTRASESDPVVRVPVDTGVAVTAMDCPTDTACVALGVGKDSTSVMRTADGGKTWSTVSNTALANLYPQDVSCASASNCVASATTSGPDSGLFRTTDGGQTWTRVVQFAAGTYAVSVDCVGGNCYAGVSVSGADDHVQRSADGGLTWTQTPDLTGLAVEALACQSETTCMTLASSVGGASTTLLSTTDGFTTSTTESTMDGKATNLECPSATTCYASGRQSAGYYGETTPIMYRSTDGGKTWGNVALPVHNVVRDHGGVQAMSCVTDDRCVIALAEIEQQPPGWGRIGRTTVFSTTDAGVTWRRRTHVDSVYTDGYKAVFTTDLACTTAGRCLVAGSLSSYRGGFIIETSNVWA